MPNEYTVVRFDGDGPFVLPPVCGPIKVCTIEGSDDLLFEWPLPPIPEQIQKIVQLQVAPEYAMALMLVLQKAQKELGLAVPEGQTTDRRFQ